MSQDLSPRSAIAIRNAFTDAFAGIRVLRDAKLIQPCLAVLYSTIDAAAWLAAEHDGDVTRKDFVSWVDRFLLPESDLMCSAIDLYAARCGVLHSFSAYSSLQRRGEARMLCYAFGSATGSQLQQFLKQMRAGDAVAVHLDTLCNALFRGWDRFLSSVESQPEAARRLSHRAGDLFSALGPDQVKPALEMTRATNG